MNTKDNENDVLIYELSFHLLPTIEEADILTQLSDIKSIIEENEGVIISEDVPKMFHLAYELTKNVDSKKQKFSKAYFGWVKFELDPAMIAMIKTKVETLPNVLRFLIVKTVRENTLHTPKIPMFKKENSREEKIEEETDKPKASEEEIDKSIDELIVETRLNDEVGQD